jgi:hypothetical protein
MMACFKDPLYPACLLQAIRFRALGLRQHADPPTPADVSPRRSQLKQALRQIEELSAGIKNPAVKWIN